MQAAIQFSQDLLDHVREVLLTGQTSQLNQAVIRRSISNSYYAVFHLTTRGAASALFADTGAADIASRAFEHTDMLKGYKGYLTKSALDNPQNKGGELFKGAPHDVKTIISELASTFEVLQHTRHQADYDFTNNLQFSSTKATQLYVLAADYVNLFQELHDDHPREFNRLIAVLLFRKQSKML